MSIKKNSWIVLTIALIFTLFHTAHTVSANTISERISGSDRIGTAIEISKKGFSSSSAVIIARSDEPADALAASSLVAAKNAPILLSRQGSLDDRVLAEIRRLGADTVYVLGGKAAISDSVVNRLKSGGVKEVKRVSGSDRFQTANEINKEAGLTNKDTAILVNGLTVADALSASSVVANKNLPIYLARQDRLPVNLPSSVKNVVIFGGTVAINSNVEQQLKNKGIKVTRISGSDRFATSVEAAKWAKLSGDKNIVVRGTPVSSQAEDYPDAVAASGLAKQYKAPILLTRPERASDSVINYIQSSNKSTTVIGGTMAVADTVFNEQSVSYGTVTSSTTLNVRNSPNGTVIGRLVSGAKVEIHEKVNGWGKIRYGNQWGYVSLSYIREDSKPPSSSVFNEIIVIDAGHGGSDPGATANGLQEKEVVLDIALRVEKKLRAAGANVVMTRTNDTFIALEERANIANRAKASSFISVHANAATEAANGSETYWLAGTSEDSKKLATAIQKHLVNELGTRDRGVKTANFSVLRNTNMPASLVEVGFLTNKAEADRMKKNGFRESAANGIYKGIVEYYNNK
ncbi:N-acetylmuramoyl-L-alanine amidase [Halalkalibacter okhensis]|uniref:N-acetylmuramoyl-L-alanine amidase n=1 Tax=Halalkalibacter okhensis TaxID=333138 RepID=UPI0006893161|nr:N-acetylmuramoyl-L-alanine amidase [Halalkalibacter okhensis]